MLVILQYFEFYTDSRHFFGEWIHPHSIPILYVESSAIHNWGWNFNPKLMCGLSNVWVNSRSNPIALPEEKWNPQSKGRLIYNILSCNKLGYLNRVWLFQHFQWHPLLKSHLSSWQGIFNQFFSFGALGFQASLSSINFLSQMHFHSWSILECFLTIDSGSLHSQLGLGYFEQSHFLHMVLWLHLGIVCR